MLPVGCVFRSRFVVCCSELVRGFGVDVCIGVGMFGWPAVGETVDFMGSLSWTLSIAMFGRLFAVVVV
ncbi:unnamed protein product [Gongylonema pulchrum]|uniref:MFS domain-containing protein n=1 Tax=Gongylonema pulchrum TaxID=637853 RepID=A0A183ETA8_9BILA|nr:unnamed protein product [Gongylonema pulchrum]